MSVSVEINGATIVVAAGLSLFESAERMDVRVPTSCKKNGKCRECIVELVEGAALLTPPSEEERHLKPPFRLACCARVAAEDGAIRCHTMRRGALRIDEVGTGLPERATNVALEPAVTRDGGWVLLDGERLVEADGPLHGLAIDLGTTTVVMRLYNLETGTLVGGESFENPQRFGGSEVMSRIAYDGEEKTKLLQRTLLGYLSHAIARLPCEAQTIYEMVVAGNTTMRDLFFGLDVQSIGQKPYMSLTEHELNEGKRESTSISVKAKHLRLPMFKDGRVYGLPLIHCHVGADTAACLLAIDLQREEHNVALMDIGTNTELVIGNKDRILCASCPAGPAFEGGLLDCGMPGFDGAIEAARLFENGRIEIDVIGDVAPVGICGSGMISALGELVRLGQMNELGRLTNNGDRLQLDVENDIYICENDISELAQAKGANVAGLDIVMRKFGLEYCDLDLFYIAGGFGRHIDLVAARRIGLIPSLDEDKVHKVGNASMEGASIALRSRVRRRELEELVRTIGHVELETDPNFFNHFVKGCQFVPVDSTACEE